MAAIKTLVYTEDGELYFYDWLSFSEEVSAQKNRNFDLVLRPVNDEVTDKQRAYYFAVVNRLIYLRLVEQGFEITEAQTHSWNKKHSLALKDSIKVPDENGQISMEDVGLEFNEAGKETISQFIDERIRFAAQSLDIYIPPPPLSGESFRSIKKDISELKRYRNK